MARARRIAIVTAVVALAAAACQLVAGIDDEVGASRAGTSGDGGDTPDAPGPDAPAKAGCGHNVPPPKPQTSDPTGKAGAPLFFAIRETFSNVDGGTVGYDLDGRCSTGGTDVPCKASPDDGDGGTDNSFFANFLANLPIPTTFGDPALVTTNDAIDAGTGGFFLAVYGYNGLEDDDKVSFALVTSPGLVSTGCTDAGGADAGPRWDGCDVWSIGSAESTATVLREQQPAYVAGGTLVARYGTKDLVTRFAGTELRLRDALVTVKLVKQTGGAFEIQNGVMTGRVSTADLIETSARVTMRLTAEASTTHLCEMRGIFDYLGDRLCPARDLRLVGDDPAATCEAMSIAIGFTASRAAFGVNGPEELLFQCPPFEAGCP
ncbi:MAG: hypothetical protein JWP87_117 [Labilithrix sp.]|nr:hypothetical protein [Labilithrix sp.]